MVGIVVVVVVVVVVALVEVAGGGVAVVVVGVFVVVSHHSLEACRVGVDKVRQVLQPKQARGPEVGAGVFALKCAGGRGVSSRGRA